MSTGPIVGSKWAKKGQKQVKMCKNIQKSSFLGQIIDKILMGSKQVYMGPNVSKQVQTGPNGSKQVQTGQNRSKRMKMGGNSEKGSNLVKTGQNYSKQVPVILCEYIFKTVKAKKKKHLSHFMCHLSNVMCHVPCMAFHIYIS